MHKAAQTFNASPEGLIKLDTSYWVNTLTLLFICHIYIFFFCPPPHPLNFYLFWLMWF